MPRKCLCSIPTGRTWGSYATNGNVRDSFTAMLRIAEKLHIYTMYTAFVLIRPGSLPLNCRFFAAGTKKAFCSPGVENWTWKRRVLKISKQSPWHVGSAGTDSFLKPQSKSISQNRAGKNRNDVRPAGIKSGCVRWESIRNGHGKMGTGKNEKSWFSFNCRSCWTFS